MASGENAKQPFSILDTGVHVDLPDHFCLERPEDDKVWKTLLFLYHHYRFVMFVV